MRMRWSGGTVVLGLGLTLGIASCEFDERSVSLVTVQANRPGGDASAPSSGGTFASPIDNPSAGSGAGAIAVTPEELAFGTSVVQFAAFRRVTVTNEGATSLTGLAISLAPESDAAFAIAQDQCPTELASGSTCDVRVQFLPTALGPVGGSLQVVSAALSAFVSLSGVGAEHGDLVLGPDEGSSTDFGATLLGAAVEATFRIDNPLDVESGVLSLDLANPAFVLQPPAPGECQSGITSLSGGASCTLRVAFQPSERGSNDATLTTSSAELGGSSIGLHGVGLAPAAIALDRSSHDFAGIVLGSSGQATISVSNSGDVPLTLSGAALAPGSDAAFSIVSSDCGAATVLGGEAGTAACSVQLEFRPTQIEVVMGGLAVAADGVPEQSVTLRGEGLLPGSLVVEPDANGSADFGSLLIGDSATRRFRVTNPGAEPSGPVSPTGSGGYEAVAPSAADDCQPGVTSLVDGASCFVSVRLTAPARGPIRGSLTVNSLLAGSKSIDLQAVGLLPATLAIDRQQVDFGRVVRGSTVTGTVAVRNTGDVAMPAPTLTLGTPTSGQAAAFGYDSSCAGNVPAGGTCAVSLRFSPTQATAHSVTLNFASSPGGSSSVLLVARVTEPGSLVLQPAPGSSANFGDVALNTSVTRQFTLSNPGGVPSGRITLTTNDQRFSPANGNCNPAGGAGLVDGSSCIFSVSFTPNTSEALSASLTATSPGAGEFTQPITGRGRNAARITGSNDFNFNTVIRGQSAVARQWTVTNDGDLTSGNLTTTGGNNEFTITNNTCTARTLPGRQTCTMLVGFTPQGNGARGGSISVSDGNSSVTLTVRGVGQPLPAVGSPCLEGRCAGTATCENHSNGQSQVCCAQDCTGNQRCSEAQNFLTCELPTVGRGQGCGANVRCAGGLTCNGSTQTCCDSSCTGPCRTCNTDGTCSTTPDGQRGNCNGQVCVGGNCSECAPNDRRCSPTNARVPQVCSAAGAFQNQTICPFQCSNGSCAGECNPNDRRCSPTNARVPQVCSAAGAFQDQTICPVLCSNGACTECSPNERRCDPVSGIPQACSVNGTWTSEARCPAVTCAGGSECLTSANLTTNLCQGAGRCKTQADCPAPTRAPLGTPCEQSVSVHRRCDEAGVCRDPTVTCGLASCAIDDDTTCCYRVAPGSLTQECSARASCAMGPLPSATTFISDVNCDNVKDCKTGEACCYIATTASHVSCVTREFCTGSPVSSAFAVCDVTGAPPADRSLQTRIPGFFCR